jgi:exopolysaccharide production protein ExoQ
MRADASGSFASRGERNTRYSGAATLDHETLRRRQIGRAMRAVESTATVLILILISDAILPLFLHGGPNYPDLTPATRFERASFWLSYAFTFAQLLVRPRQILRAAARNPFVFGVVFIAALSIAWSDDPNTSLRRAFALGMWTLFGYYLASRYDTTELLQHLAIALGILAVLSLATGALLPDYGRESGFNGGAWRGVYTTKNVLGEMMLLAAVVFGSLARRANRAKTPAVLGILLVVTLIVFARATAASLIVLLLVITIPIVLMFRRRAALAAMICCCLLGFSAVGLVASVNEQTVLNVVGKDATLTGRTVLWEAVIQRIEDRPVLGYGYGAFWEPNTASSERVRAAVGWDVPHAHNGILDTWLDLGLIGVLSLSAAYVLALRRAWTGLRTRVGIEGVWAMTFLVMLFLGNTTESSISQSPFIWAIFVAVACMRWPRYPSSDHSRGPDRRGADRHSMDRLSLATQERALDQTP